MSPVPHTYSCDPQRFFNYPIQGSPIFGNGLEVGALHSLRLACGVPSHQGLSCQEFAVNEEENSKIR